MKLTFIECNNCDSQKGIVMSDTHANCVSCNRPYSLTGTPVFYPIDELTPLQEIAKQQACNDIIEEQLESMYRRDKAGQDACAYAAGYTELESDAFWATCFKVEETEWAY